MLHWKMLILEMAEQSLVIGVPATHRPSPGRQPGPLGWVGRWRVGENVAYVSDEKGGGVLAGLRVSGSQLCGLRQTALYFPGPRFLICKMGEIHMWV